MSCSSSACTHTTCGHCCTVTDNKKLLYCAKHEAQCNEDCRGGQEGSCVQHTPSLQQPASVQQDSGALVLYVHFSSKGCPYCDRPQMCNDLPVWPQMAHPLHRCRCQVPLPGKPAESAAASCDYWCFFPLASQPDPGRLQCRLAGRPCPLALPAAQQWHDGVLP